MIPEDISDLIAGAESMSPCPLCKGLVFDNEQGTLVTAFNAVCLAHAECVEMEIEEQEEK